MARGLARSPTGLALRRHLSEETVSKLDSVSRAEPVAYRTLSSAAIDRRSEEETRSRQAARSIQEDLDRLEKKWKLT
jgi:hypothetical protein